MPRSRKPTSKQRAESDFLRSFDEILNEASMTSGTLSRTKKYWKNLPFESQNVTSVDDELAKKKHLENLDLEQDIQLKRLAIHLLFIFLAVETFVVFLFMFLQATTEIGPLFFRLDEWSFRLVIAATITQITLMLTIAVQYLFPKRTN